MARLGLLVVVAALALTGCELNSPDTISSPYPASDGTSGKITDPASGSTVRLQNFLVVSAGPGRPGSVLGAIANDGKSPVAVTLTLYKDDSSAGASQPSGQTTVQVPAHEMVTLGQTVTPASAAAAGGAPSLVLDSTPQPPGALLTLRARTGAGGSVQFTVPVLPPVGAYSSFTPTASPTASPSASPSASASAGASPSS